MTDQQKLIHPNSQDIEVNRKKILNIIGAEEDITFFVSWGNIGDHLIWEGTRQLLSERNFKEVSINSAKNTEGKVAIITGGGGWCRPFHAMPSFLQDIEERFDKVVVLPSSFDTSVDVVKKEISTSKAFFLCRELYSYNAIKDLCNADFAYDCAFFFDFSPYVKNGEGVLNAFRVDDERKYNHVPKNNNDISITTPNMSEWLKKISLHDTVRTDRAHVMIAAAMLNKTVYYRSSYYHKVPGIAEFSLKDFPVYREES